PLGVTAELRRRERAEGYDDLTCGASILDGALHHLRTNALATKRIRHARMIDDDLARADLGEGHLGFRAVGRLHHVASLRFAVFQDDFDVIAHVTSPD